MRRGLASLIIGLSLLVATASWAGFTLSRTLLDPGRSERLADQLLDNPDVRSALVSRLADALEAQIPDEVPVSRQVVEAGAELALDDPQVEALVRDGFVQVHQAALAGEAEPVFVDAGALGSAGREALVGSRPELDPFLPAAPAVEVELPTAGLSWLGTVKDVVDRFTLLGAIVATIGAVTAFAVAKDRAPVLRRVAFWGYGAAAFWIVLGYGLPRLASLLSPTSGAIATAAVDVFFGAMIGPAVTMIAIATMLLLAGFLLPTFQRRRGARVLQPRGAGGGAVAAARTAVQPTPRPPTGSPARHPTAEPAPAASPATPRHPTAGPAPWVPAGSTDPTERMPRPLIPTDGAPDQLRPNQPGPAHNGSDHAMSEPAMTSRAWPEDTRGTSQKWQPGEGYLDEQPTERTPIDRPPAADRSTPRSRP